jgi:hypothetical protein
VLVKDSVGGCSGGFSTPVVVVQSVENWKRDEPCSLRAGRLVSDPVWSPLPNPLVRSFSIPVRIGQRN